MIGSGTVGIVLVGTICLFGARVAAAEVPIPSFEVAQGADAAAESFERERLRELDRLHREALGKYRQGDRLGARANWEAMLRIEPGNRRATVFLAELGAPPADPARLPSSPPPEDVPPPAGRVELLGRLGGFGFASDLAVRDEVVFVAADDAGLLTVDVSDPSAPELLASYGTPGRVHGMKLSGSVAYVDRSVIPNGAARVEFVDLSNARAPRLLGSYEAPDLLGCAAVSGSVACMRWSETRRSSGLRFLDVANPWAPAALWHGETPDFAWGVAVSGRTAFVALGRSGLQVLDVSNPSAPTVLGLWGMPVHGSFARDVVVSGTIAYVPTHYPVLSEPPMPPPSGAKGLLILDVSNPGAPVPLGFHDMGGYAESVAVYGTLAYVAATHLGLLVLDVSQPSNPVPLASYKDSTGSISVAVSGDVVYLASDAGLQILRYVPPPADPPAPIEVPPVESGDGLDATDGSITPL